jgi:hypothetical protein
MRPVQGGFEGGETLQTMERVSDEIRRLRRCVRDLVALSALPRVWIDKTHAEIAGGIVDMLRRALRPDLVYVCLNGLADGVTAEAASVDHRAAIPTQVAEIGGALAPWLKTKSFLACTAIPNPVSSGTLQMAVLPIGHAGEYGVVAVGSRLTEFPSELDRLLLDVTIHQMVLALQEVRLVTALHGANLAKDQWLAHEQVLRAEAEAARQQTITILERITGLFVALDHEAQFTSLNVPDEQLPQGMQRTRAVIIGQIMEANGLRHLPDYSGPPARAPGGRAWGPACAAPSAHPPRPGPSGVGGAAPAPTGPREYGRGAGFPAGSPDVAHGLGAPRADVLAGPDARATHHCGAGSEHLRPHRPRSTSTS